MGYWTYFEGEIGIKIDDYHLNILKSYITRKFDLPVGIEVNRELIVVNDEWKNGSIMQDIISFISVYGELQYGYISCEGEDETDVWEIRVVEKKAYIREHGTATTLDRVINKERLENSLI